MGALTGNPGKWLRDDAAAAFNRMVAARGPIGVNSAGRTLGEQQGLINRWNRGGAANRPPYLYEPKRPAGASNHVASGGIAFDTSDWRRVAGFASQYGFSHPYPSSDPVHFEYVGGGSGGGGGNANVGAGQRAAAAVVNRRSAPSSSASIAGEPLQPGAIGNFVGWKRGENVSGNDVWYQGTSGHWFWSGGFKEGANGTGLKDLNPAAPPAVSATQRVVLSTAPANRRIGAPSSSAKAGEQLAPGTVGNFTHWTRGESVNGNDVWFKGTSGDYFWSGGFVGGANTAGLPEEVRTPTPSLGGSNQRKVISSDSVRGRNQPSTAGAIVQELAPGTVADFKGYVEGQVVNGNNVWFVGSYAGNYFWSGGFEGGANTAGLPKIDGSTPAPTPQPGAAVQVTPVYPGAKEGWDTPRGREKREKYGDRPGVQVDTAAIHYTGNTADNLNYFKGSGEGSVPTWYVRPNGDMFEMCRPDLRPVTTYKANNFSVSFEIQMLADGTVSLESLEAVAKCLAWLEAQTSINGVAFKYKTTRDQTKGHREFPENSTACPGDFVMARMDSLVARAKEIRAGETKPVDPPKPDKPSTDGDNILVPKSWLQDLIDKAKGFISGGNK